MAGADSKKVVLAAMAGNGLIAVSKFVAAGFTGSAAMLAEAVHSVADTGNQALLMLGMRLSKSEPTERHPFGRAVERYFWPFVVSIMLFTVGGAFAIYEGIHRLGQVQTMTAGAMGEGNILWNYIVLGLAILFEAGAFIVALREFRAIKGRRGTMETLVETKDPTIPVVLMEDSSALLGLILALLGVTLTHVTGWPGWDGIASLLIGVLLCAVAVFLAKETHSLILGESAPRRDRARIRDIASSVDGIERITQLLSMHRGPNDVLLALKVAFRSDLDVEQVEATTDALERKIRDEMPQMKHIFVEPDAEHEPQPHGRPPSTKASPASG